MTPRSLFLALVLATGACAETAAERPVIDVAFCIDTTGSMQSYIDATKKKVWDIANGLLKGTPRPIVRLAVVAYRDRNEAYLTQQVDLTDDIDRVHSFLMDLKAQGGGDGPEHVTAGLSDCVERLSWSKGKRVLKAVYLIGDAPAHVDYDDGDFRPVAKKAIAQGINIHTLACSGSAEVEQWKEIAKLTDGQFIQLPPLNRFAGRAPAPTAATGVAPAPLMPMAPGAEARGLAMEKDRARAESSADLEGGAPMAAPADEAVGDKILDSLKSEAKKKGVASY